MTDYRLKNPNVQAFQYNGEFFDALPEWLKNYSLYQPLNGAAIPYRSPVGVLMVPNATGYTQCTTGDWVVKNSSAIFVVKAKQFEELYEPVPDETEAAPDPVPTPEAEAPKED